MEVTSTQDRPRRTWVGKPFPLGARYDGSGTNFSIFSSVADGVELCLHGHGDENDDERIELTEVDGHIWHTYLPDVRPGTAVRLSRPRPVGTGERVVVQPVEVAPRPVREGDRWTDRLGPGVLRLRLRRARLETNTDDSAPHVWKAVVGDPFFDWGNDRPPRDPAARDRDLRGTRPRHDDDPPERARSAPRHVRGDRPPGDHRASPRTSGSRRSS